MKRRTLRYESQSLLRAVEAANSIIMGDSMIIESAKTTPYAAKLIWGSASRETTALTAGSSNPMSIQLAANGHHARKIRRNDSGAWLTAGAVATPVSCIALY
jgi:hypothetical protein